MAKEIKETVQTSGKYDDMSEDEMWEESLKEHGLTEDTDSEDSKEVDDEEETESEESQDDDSDQTTTDEQADDDEVDDPFFKGKSKKELVDIVKKNNTYISQVKNEMHGVKEQLEKINSASTKKEVSEAKGELDEILADYKQEDVSAIMKIVKKAIKDEKNEDLEKTKQATEAERKTNESSNENFWEVFQFANPELAKKIEPELMKSITNDTIVKKDFVKGFIGEFQSKKGATKPVTSEGLIKKKRNASTAGSAGTSSTTSDSSLKGKPEPSDPDEYVKWLEANKGIKI